jgi:hypothetical protein
MTDKTCEFEADLTPSNPLCRENWPRVRFNFDNGWSASLIVRTRGSTGKGATTAMQASLACAPTGQWREDKTELGESEATADEAIAWLAEVAGREAV